MEKIYTIDLHSAIIVGTAQNIEQAKRFAKNWSVYEMKIVEEVREATEEDISYYLEGGGIIEELD